MLKKKENLWKIVGCFWAWQMVSFGFGFFEVLILKRFVFGVSGIVSKVLKMLVFPVFWAFLGWLIIVHLGLDALGVFVFLVFVFLCCVAFVSVLFALLLVLWLFCFLFVGFFCFLCLFLLGFLFFFVSVFFWGFKGQVRWPKGPPHLALNPAFFVFCFPLPFLYLLLNRKTQFFPP